MMWDNTLHEACISNSPLMLRNLFSIMLYQCEISEPLRLWNKFKEDLSKDILYRSKLINSESIYNDNIFNLSLIDIEDKLVSIGGKELINYGLPKTNRSNLQPLTNQIIRETSYDINELEKFIEENEYKLKKRLEI